MPGLVGSVNRLPSQTIAQRFIRMLRPIERGILRDQSLRKLLAGAKAGDTAPDHVLQVLTLVELWQQEVF